LDAVFSRLASLGTDRFGSGDPNGLVSGSVGDIFKRSNGGLHTSIYAKTSGTNTDTGWTALANYYLATTTVKGLVNQSSASADSALEPSLEYSQSEVQSILAELRDLKYKMRTAGILAT
jgi:hypothetical protein